MEQHKELSQIEEWKPPLNKGAQAYFDKALVFSKKFYSNEIESIASVTFDDVTPDSFFREYIWVVHATGFSAKVVGNFIPRLLPAYGLYDDLAEKSFDEAFSRIKKVCNNRAKSLAVWKTAKEIVDNVGPFRLGWGKYKKEKLSSPQLLTNLPYIGKVTCYHLARNIGMLDVVKPDLHLIRMAKHWGYEDCISMCKDVQPENMPLGIVDLVLWYAASTFGTLEIKEDGDR